MVQSLSEVNNNIRHDMVNNTMLIFGRQSFILHLDLRGKRKSELYPQQKKMFTVPHQHHRESKAAFDCLVASLFLLYIKEFRTEMQADPKPPSNTLAEERKNITPGDADSWFDSDAASQASESDSDSEDLKSSDGSMEESQPRTTLQKKSEQEGRQQGDEEGKELKKQEEKKKAVKRQLKSFPHKVEKKFIVLLKIMVAAGKVDLKKVAGLQQGQGFVELPANGPTITVWASSKEQAHSAINNLADFIDDLEVMKLDIRPQYAHKLASFKGIKRDFFRRLSMFMFGMDNQKGVRQAFIGGKVKFSDLRKIQEEIKNFRVMNFSLKRFQNKRSYKLVINRILNSDTSREQLMKFNRINLIEVDTKTQDSSLRFYMNTMTKSEISGVECEMMIYKIVKGFFVVTFAMRREKYYPKLEVKDRPDIWFKIVKDHNVPLSYLYLVCRMETFFNCREAIEKELGKCGEFIIGIRFFNNLEPSFRWMYFDKEVYVVNKFPKANPYSMSVSAKTKEGKQFHWHAVYTQILQLEDKYSREEVMEEGQEEQ